MALFDRDNENHVAMFERFQARDMITADDVTREQARFRKTFGGDIREDTARRQIKSRRIMETQLKRSRV